MSYQPPKTRRKNSETMARVITGGLEGCQAAAQVAWVSLIRLLALELIQHNPKGFTERVHRNNVAGSGDCHAMPKPWQFLVMDNVAEYGRPASQAARCTQYP